MMAATIEAPISVMSDVVFATHMVAICGVAEGTAIVFTVRRHADTAARKSLRLMASSSGPSTAT